MSSSKEAKKNLAGTSWHINYEIVYEHFRSLADSKGFKANVRGFCDFLEISAGKRQKWSLGQWPSAEDLEKLHDRLGFSYRWLITGEGEPFEEGRSRLEAGIAKKEEEARVQALEARLQELEQENAALRAKLTSSEVGELSGRLAELESTVRQLQTRLLIDGVGDKNAAIGIGKAADGQG